METKELKPIISIPSASELEYEINYLKQDEKNNPEDAGLDNLMIEQRKYQLSVLENPKNAHDSDQQLEEKLFGNPVMELFSKEIEALVRSNPDLPIVKDGIPMPPSS